MSQLLEVGGRYAGLFDRQPFPIRHRLAGHPMFELDRLLELSRRLREDCVEFHAGDVPVYVAPERTPSTGLSLEETIRNIESCGSWVVLKDVGQDPAYRTLLDECLDEVHQRYRSSLRGASDRVGFVFISSAGAITPCHLDPEHNFLLQIRGAKTIHVGERSLVAGRELERYFTGGHRNVELPADPGARVAAFRLAPGDGVHVPFMAPHWVMNGDEVSVSFSITFQTPSSLRSAVIHKVNARIRRAGICPTPPGRAALRDAFKVLGFEAARKAHRLAQRLARGTRPSERT